MVATPCPLVIAIPVAIIGSVAMAARRGILIKDPAVLEKIDTCRIAIFDKTGTLTYGQPTLTEVLPDAGFTKDETLTAVASLERYSRHPLASAMIDAATDAARQYFIRGDDQEKANVLEALSYNDFKLVPLKMLPHALLHEYGGRVYHSVLQDRGMEEVYKEVFDELRTTLPPGLSFPMCGSGCNPGMPWSPFPLDVSAAV